MVAEYSKSVASIVHLELLFFTLLIFVSCRPTDQIEREGIPLATTQPSWNTPTPFPPSPTPLPLAAIVNDEQITLSQYQAELERYKMAIGTDLAAEDELYVLNDLIDQYLLSQAAREHGFVADSTIIEERIETLVTRLGSTKAFSNWMAEYGYSEEDFHKDLGRSIEAAWMRDLIISQVEVTAEQIHVRQILLYYSDQANEVIAKLQGGEDFDTLASQYDPVTKGDLGWFPRGYLLDEELEQVAFSLQPGEFSGVIHTIAGYHIVQLIERDPQRPLEPNALSKVKLQAIENWLEEKRSQSYIQVLLP